MARESALPKPAPEKAASGRQAVPRESLLSIGQVLARLSPEFPDLSPS